MNEQNNNRRNELQEEEKNKQELKLIHIIYFFRSICFICRSMGENNSRQWENKMRIHLVFRFIDPWSVSRNMMSTMRGNAILWVSLYISGLRWGLAKGSSWTHVYPIQGLSRVNLKWVYSLAFQMSDFRQICAHFYNSSWWLEPVFLFLFARLLWIGSSQIWAPFRFHKLIGRDIETFHVLLCFFCVSYVIDVGEKITRIKQDRETGENNIHVVCLPSAICYDDQSIIEIQTSNIFLDF